MKLQPCRLQNPGSAIYWLNPLLSSPVCWIVVPVAPTHQCNARTDASDCSASIWYLKELDRHFKVLSTSCESMEVISHQAYFKKRTVASGMKIYGRGTCLYQLPWSQVMHSHRHLLQHFRISNTGWISGNISMAAEFLASLFWELAWLGVVVSLPSHCAVSHPGSLPQDAFVGLSAPRRLCCLASATQQPSS